MEKKIRSYMTREAENCRDEFGEINLTQLAENAAQEFNLDSLLDEENSILWEIASEFFDK